MRSIQLSEPVFLAGPGGIKYRNITYNGTLYHFTVAQRSFIHSYDQAPRFVACHNTRRVYDSITFNGRTGGYFATSTGNRDQIFILDECFRESDVLYCGLGGLSCAPVSGISYNCCNNTLYASTGDRIFEAGTKAQEILCMPGHLFLSVLAYGPYLITASLANCAQYVTIFSLDGTQLEKICTDETYVIENILLDYVSSTGAIRLLLLTSKGCSYSYLSTLTIDGLSSNGQYSCPFMSTCNDEI